MKNMIMMAALAAGLSSAVLAAPTPFNVNSVPHQRLQLWPEGKMPQVATNLDNQAWIEVYLPTGRVHNAFTIIAPGGCYVWWCWGGEGTTMLEHCLRHNMPAAQLKYRCPRPIGNTFYLNAWQDAQRAVRVVRSHAAEWGIDPENIGFNGYSAGGHLTLMTALSSSSNSYSRVDAIDDLPCNVNWAIPVYPAYVLSDCQNNWGGGSKKGNDLSLEIRPEFLFDKGTPPLCLFHGDADDISAMGSFRVYHKLRTMGIPGEIHVFANKGHVFFTNASDGESCKTFRDTAFGWLNSMGFTLETPRVLSADGKPVEALRAGVRGFALKLTPDKKLADLVKELKRPEVRMAVELVTDGLKDAAAREAFVASVVKESAKLGLKSGVLSFASADAQLLEAVRTMKAGSPTLLVDTCDKSQVEKAHESGFKVALRNVTTADAWWQAKAAGVDAVTSANAVTLRAAIGATK